MKTLTKFFLFMSIICVITIIGLFIVALMEDGPNQNVSPTRSEIVPLENVTKRPCTSLDEWHNRADQMGYWMEGFQVNESTSNDEIARILADHKISPVKPVAIQMPHNIGYYLEIPEKDYYFSGVQKNINLSMNVSLSYGSYAFVEPSIKKFGDVYLVPVFVFYSPQMGENATYLDTINRGLPLKKTKVVKYDFSFEKTPQERVRFLNELNTDPRVLFVFREYREGVLC